MNAVKWTLAVALLSVTTVGGCASVPPEAGFRDVQAVVAERTGKRVHWDRGTSSDAAVDGSVRSMLQETLTVDSAVQVALLNNRGLRATYEELAVAQADLVAAGLLRNPVFDAELRFPEGGGGTGLELAVVQDFIDVFYIPLRKRMAGAAFEAAKLRVSGEAIDLAGNVRAAFHTLQATQQSLELRRQVVTATEASYDLARRLRAAGNISELDLANERALYEQSKLNVAEAEAQLVQDRERLTTLMGLYGTQTQWTVSDRLPDLPADDPAAEGLERRAVERSMELGVARLGVRRAARGLSLARPLGFFGEVEVGAVAEREPEGEWTAGPVFSLPLPLFDQGQPAVAAACAELRRAREEYVALAVELRSRVRAAWAAAAAARQRANHYAKVMLPLRQAIVDQTQLQYNAMQIGTFQLLQAKQQQIDAGEQYVTALRDYWLAQTELDQLLSGRMTRVTSRPDGGGARAAAAAGSGAATNGH